MSYQNKIIQVPKRLLHNQCFCTEKFFHIFLGLDVYYKYWGAFSLIKWVNVSDPSAASQIYMRPPSTITVTFFIFQLAKGFFFTFSIFDKSQNPTSLWLYSYGFFCIYRNLLPRDHIIIQFMAKSPKRKNSIIFFVEKLLQKRAHSMKEIIFSSFSSRNSPTYTV